MSFAAMMLVAMALDVLLGWPDWLYRRIGHPVTWIGAMISHLERSWNVGTASAAARKRRGVAAAVLVITCAGGLALTIQWMLPAGWVGAVLGGLLAWPLLAIRSMHDHVAAVLRPLASGDLPGARRAVSMIVGRDPSQLDSAGIARAATESLAENTSDGIMAPLFWGVVAGLPGVAAYKAINTLDSMVGYRTPRFADFGWASARIDDLANLIPARLTGLVFALVSTRPRAALACMLRDAGQHRSPNAGWPEAAMAGALGIRLSGPRAYAGEMTGDPFVNAICPDPTAGDLRKGLALYRRGILALAAAVAVLVVAGI
ncbi:adenosylcobinamide-phosphate synthase CbiB [Roseinatronobacter alkalisoli]|uniref:Cobalamin biosynthesis protein CobD n=1 Tax=Roseinatronobacter alkalisoli TaxID=3028235 RepID=A0ABT5T6M8_9RHOB|nr:adenosylcobinamide-phosphate synthase CbiB [Roseinatronobacter sp. HJB301]MDD7970778.1 adenosylcobinamide-phosphate synthase CbiB [Roseinatronobacter sp. HJB301]